MAETFETVLVEETKTKKNGAESKLEDLMNDCQLDRDKEATLYLFRHKGTSQQHGLVRLDVFPADQYSFDELFLHIRENYGEGLYRIRVKRKGDRGFCINELLEIELPKKAAAYHLHNTLEHESPKNDEKLVSLIRELTLNNRPNEEDEDEREFKFLKKMQLYKDLFAPPAQASPQAQPGLDLLAAVKMLKDLGLNIGQKEDENFSKVISEALPIFDKITTSVIEPSNKEKTKKPEKNPPKIESQVNPFVEFLLNCAEEESNPELYAEVIIDKFPPTLLGAFLYQSDYLSMLCKNVDPRFANYPNWVAEVRLKIIELVEEMKKDEQEEEAAQEAQQDESTDAIEEASTVFELPQRAEGG